MLSVMMLAVPGVRSALADEVAYELNGNGNGLIVKAISGSIEEMVTIPEFAGYQGADLPVIGIKEKGFEGNIYLKKVILPASLATIGNRAFYGCTNLKDVTFSDGLKSVGKSAFAKTAMTSVELPSTVETVDEMAFAEMTKVATIDLHKCGLMSSVPYCCFWNDPELESVLLPGNIESLGYAVFGDLPKLKEIFFFSKTAPDMPQQISYDPLKDVKIFVPKGSEETYNEAFEGYLRKFPGAISFSIVPIPEEMLNPGGDDPQTPDTPVIRMNCEGLSEIHLDGTLSHTLRIKAAPERRIESVSLDGAPLAYTTDEETGDVLLTLPAHTASRELNIETVEEVETSVTERPILYVNGPVIERIGASTYRVTGAFDATEATICDLSGRILQTMPVATDGTLHIELPPSAAPRLLRISAWHALLLPTPN